MNNYLQGWFVIPSRWDIAQTYIFSSSSSSSIINKVINNN